MIEQVFKVFADFEKNYGFSNLSLFTPQPMKMFVLDFNNPNNLLKTNTPPSRMLTWIELDSKWELMIPSTHAEITIGEEIIEIEYHNEVKTENGKSTKKGYIKLPYPKDTIFESLNAKKDDKKGIISVTIDKLHPNKENKRKIVFE